MAQASPPEPSPSPSGELSWYGNIQYLINISGIGALVCVCIFVLVKLRSDQRSIPGSSALIAKLLAVWHSTGREIARHCGVDAAQFLIIEGGIFAVLSATSLVALLLILPLNFYAGTAKMDDQFSKTSITHVAKGSPLLWLHFVFVIIILLLVHYGICQIEERLKVTRFGDGYGNPSSTSSSIFTIMVQGVPKRLAGEEYFHLKYPAKL